MGAVEPDVRLCPLPQIFGIRAVVDDAEVIVRSAGVAHGPSDDGQIVVSQLQRWSLNDLDLRGFFQRRNQLSAGRRGKQQAAYYRRYRESEEHSVRQRLCALSSHYVLTGTGCAGTRMQTRPARPHNISVDDDGLDRRPI